ncbi:hypothetical protein ACFQX7_26335 [Luedemannella flava]
MKKLVGPVVAVVVLAALITVAGAVLGRPSGPRAAATAVAPRRIRWSSPSPRPSVGSPRCRATGPRGRGWASPTWSAPG